MIRWTAGLALVVTLLAPIQAFAACAWVLWSETSGFSAGQMKSAKSLSPYTAFETKAECEDSLLARWQRTRDQWIEAGGGETKVHPDLSMSEVSSTPGRVTITRKGQKGNLLEKTTFWYQCWPDTIDPRGPKGSER